MFVERVLLRLYMVHRLGVLPRAHKDSRGAMEIGVNFCRLLMTRKSGEYRGCCI